MICDFTPNVQKAHQILIFEITTPWKQRCNDETILQFNISITFSLIPLAGNSSKLYGILHCFICIYIIPEYVSRLVPVPQSSTLAAGQVVPICVGNLLLVCIKSSSDRFGWYHHPTDPFGLTNAKTQHNQKSNTKVTARSSKLVKNTFYGYFEDFW